MHYNNFMENKTFDISFDHDGKYYQGWATPSGKKDNGKPRSFHVVLNRVMFGNVSHNDTTWVVDEQRPDELTQAVGKFIEEVYQSV